MSNWIVSALTVMVLACGAGAQPPRPGKTVDWSKVAKRIAWFGTWKGALAAAQRTGRPVLLISAAPHCHQISGVW